MNKLKECIKIIIIYIARIVLKFFWIIPVKKQRILFCSFDGEQYSCNPKYVFLKLREDYGNTLEYIWCLNKKFSNNDLLGIKTVRYLSFKHIFYIISSGIYIKNTPVEPFIPHRKSQLVINTWHGGGAYKALNDFYLKSKSYNIMNHLRNKITTYFLSSCNRATVVDSRDWKADIDKFLPTGTPRTDFIINNLNNMEKVNSIKLKLGIDKNLKIVLFAPTWRFLRKNCSEDFKFDLNIERITSALSKRFNGDFVFLFRGHHNFKKIIILNDYNKMIDVSDYDDMQELLLITDVLITDYSSSIWDFAFTFKPGFLYTPDIVEFTKFQHFYTPMTDWHYDYATTNEELVKLIENYNENIANEKIKKHLELLGSYEEGDASYKVKKIIDAYYSKK